jgi:spermidine synthase
MNYFQVHKKFLPETVVFVSGAVLMMLELVGSRVLAPFLGTSTIVWTSLIGIIMGALSLGYWYGGKLADKTLSLAVLSQVLLNSGVLIGVTAVLHPTLMPLINNWIGNLMLGSVVAATLLFSPASFVLGMVSPYTIRLSIQDVKDSGSVVGRLYAISTLGSIVGTFLAGFILIAFIGTKNLLYILSALQLLLSAIVKFRQQTIYVAAFLVAAFALQTKNTLDVVADIDTTYNRVVIRDWDKGEDGRGRPVRYMRIGDERSSAIFLDGDELVFDYIKFYHTLRHFKPDFKKVLMIGGAGYTFPTDFVKKYPNAEIHVVEIDPALAGLAKKYFRLQDHPNLKIIHEDGRTFLNKTATEQYDVILIDAYKSKSVPFQLSTRETVSRIKAWLKPDGVVIANFIAGLSEPKSRFIRAQVATYREQMPVIALFTLGTKTNPEMLQNVMMVASNVPLNPIENAEPALQDLLSRYYGGRIGEDLPVLTDNFAPVDYYSYFVSYK